jgi:hypothetical protein
MLLSAEKVQVSDTTMMTKDVQLVNKKNKNNLITWA